MFYYLLFSHVVVLLLSGCVVIHGSPERRSDLPSLFRYYYLLRPDQGDFRLDYYRDSGRADFVIR